MKRKLTLAVFTLALAACASAPPARQSAVRPGATPQRPTLTPTAANPDRDALELRAALEDAYRTIEARGNAAKSPQVDADAILSLPIPDHRTIRGAIQYFSTDLKDKIQESLVRSARYKLLIDAVLDEYKLPRAFAYLPVIESAYIPTLTSRVGAYGIWQFMPSTAREMGLRVDWWVDERANPQKSTRAAAQYLRQLYTQFGDWSLVLAAYNAGPGRIRRALDTTGATTFWQLLEAGAVPKETRGYVPTFYATITIASDPQSYGFELREPMEHKERVVPVTGPVSFEYLASVAGVTPDVITELNPELRRATVPPGRTEIVLPERAAKAVAERADSLRYDDPYVAVTSFTLRDGDSIPQLARLTGWSSDDIVKMNGRRTADCAPGETILLPVQKTKLSNLLQDQSRPADQFYVVSQGDTLYSIARNHGLRVEELLDLNQLDSNEPIHAGQRLRVALGAAMTGGM